MKDPFDPHPSIHSGNSRPRRSLVYCWTPMGEYGFLVVMSADIRSLNSNTKQADQSDKANRSNTNIFHFTSSVSCTLHTARKLKFLPKTSKYVFFVHLEIEHHHQASNKPKCCKHNRTRNSITKEAKAPT